MLTNLLFFIIAGSTLTLLLWMGMELFRTQEDPLGDRLETAADVIQHRNVGARGGIAGAGPVEGVRERVGPGPQRRVGWGVVVRGLAPLPEPALTFRRPAGRGRLG